MLADDLHDRRLRRLWSLRSRSSCTAHAAGKSKSIRTPAKRSRRQSNEARWSTPCQRIESQTVRSADIPRHENEGARRASVTLPVLRLGCDLATNTECFRVEARAAGYALLPRRILRSRPWSRLILQLPSDFHSAEAGQAGQELVSQTL